MQLSSILALAAAALPALGSEGPQLERRQDTWGGAVSLGPTTSTIIKAVTTLAAGRAPTPQNGVLFLWPGMSNGTGHLVQATLESWNDNSWCGAVAGEWCVRASVFGWFGQRDGPAGKVGPNDRVTIDYTLQPDNINWVQRVTNADTGALLSTYTSDSENYMRGYGTGTECNAGCSPTISDQTYTNTVITLAGPDPNFGRTIATSHGATYTGLTSSEGGKVWTIQRMFVPKMV